jgi:Fe-S-cluster-containing hydrogenase component 2
MKKLRNCLTCEEALKVYDDGIVTYSLKARIVGSQQPAVTRQRSTNNSRGIVFSTQSMPMSVHATLENVIPSLSNNYTVTEERCFLCGACLDYIMR